MTFRTNNKPFITLIHPYSQFFDRRALWALFYVPALWSLDGEKSCVDKAPVLCVHWFPIDISKGGLDNWMFKTSRVYLHSELTCISATELQQQQQLCAYFL